MPLIEEKDLKISNRFGGKYISRFLMYFLGINRINQCYDQLSQYRSTAFTSKFFVNQKITYSLSESALANIPKTGGAVVIANHPTGALDGILLIDALGKIRPDVKFMGNFLLMRIKNIEDYFLPVDPFHLNNSSNITGIKRAFDHVQNGGMLVVFPSGEVSTWQRGFQQVEDKTWSKSVVKLIRKLNVPIVPIYLDGKNSLKFHLVGKIHPLLRTIRLPLELLNKQGTSYQIRVGSPILPNRQQAIKDPQKFSNYLRASVYYLRYANTSAPVAVPNSEPVQEIISATNVKNILPELEHIRKERLLFESGDYSVFFAPSGEIPFVMKEIARLREVTFRAVGEGTNKALDMDLYDNYYYQLFVWDGQRHSLVGAYRVGLGNQIMKEHGGIEGFYTHTLFALSNNMRDILGQTIELGRSFVVKEYQRKPASLMLLWRGILQVLLNHRECRYLLGPVSISGEFNDASKWMIMNYIREFHFNKSLAKFVRARIGMKGLEEVDVSLLSGIGNIELVDRLVRDLEGEGVCIPILIKKYLQLNGKIIAFNVDPDFNNSLDALILVDLKHIPQRTIDMLSKEVSSESVRERIRERFGAVGRHGEHLKR